MAEDLPTEPGQDSPAESVLSTISIDNLKYASLPHSLERSLHSWLSNFVAEGTEFWSDGTHLVNSGTWMENADRAKIITRLGSDFLKTELFSAYNKRIFYQGQSQTRTVVAARLSLADKLSFAAFEAGLQRLLEDSDKVDMLVNASIARSSGIRKGKQVPVRKKKLLQLIPELHYLHEIQGDYYVPKDQYALLLAVPVEHRRFLSLCFDRAEELQVQPFNVAFDKDRNVTELILGYSLTEAEAMRLAEYGLLSAQTMLDVASKVGIKDIAPYMKTIQKLAHRLNP
ncbi:hypothetical protein KY329_01030 [Candidatus Woesearchaeota archaeon]|nr:hypothetical protein [Candidatus Woesearchaeota archaeon]